MRCIAVSPREFQALAIALLAVGGMFCADLAFAQADNTKAPSVTAKSGKEAVGPAAYSPQVKFIDEQIRAVWADFKMNPSQPATEGEWCRRVFLDIIGRIPSVEEINAFVNSKDADKKLKLVDALLTSDKYTEEYARNMTTIWTNVLIGRAGGTEENTLTNREGMQKYLRDAFARNKPYDKMVMELVTATGVNTPGEPGFNGAVNFMTMKLDEKAAQATAQTARVFLGMQVQCTQCHNHPFNEWKQRKFWELNAFFQQTKANRKFTPGTRDVMSVELVNTDFGGESNNAEEAEIFYELRNGLMKSAFPTFVDGTEIGRSGFVSDVNRRNELGKLIVNSPSMDQAIVNRMWQHFLGYGFTKPVDDMGPHNPPSHPALLEQLGKDFRYQSFNLKELIKWITLSEAYSLSSKANPSNLKDDPLLGETPKFTHFYLRQMRAEELYESLLVATEAHKTTRSYEEQEKMKREWLSQFVVAFGTDEGDEATTFNGTIPQALMMFNGDLIKQATNIEKGSFLGKVAASPMKPADKISFLFISALGRKPNAVELRVADQLVAARKGDTAAALQDMWWAVLNSNEFIMNH